MAVRVRACVCMRVRACACACVCVCVCGRDLLAVPRACAITDWWFPQQLDSEYLVIWDGFRSYGSQVSWSRLTENGLRTFLMARIEEVTPPLPAPHRAQPAAGSR